MPTEYPVISAHASIAQQSIWLNGKKVFQDEKSTHFKAFAKAAYQAFELSYPKFHKMDQLSKLGFLCAETLLKDQNIKNYAPQEISVVIANKNSSLDTDEKYLATLDNIVPSPSLFVYTLPNILIGEICIRHQIKGEQNFFLSESFDINFVSKYVIDIFHQKLAKACITGWIEYYKDEYQAHLFYVESKTTGMPFNIENLSALFRDDKRIICTFEP